MGSVYFRSVLLSRLSCSWQFLPVLPVVLSGALPVSSVRFASARACFWLFGIVFFARFFVVLALLWGLPCFVSCVCFCFSLLFRSVRLCD